MRNGQNNKRMRNRNNNNNNNSNNDNRRGQNPMTRVFESNGPDIKIRGTASHVAEKYVQLARDARSSGDPVAAENYYQHAEHYFRLIAAAQEQFRQNQPQPRTDNEMACGGRRRRGRELFAFRPGARLRPGAAAAVRAARQRSARSAARRPALPAARPAQPREHGGQREHRPQPQYQPQPQPQPQPVIADTASVDRLPSFITGPQPQVGGAPGGFDGGERRALPAAAPPAAWPASRGHGPAPAVPGGDDFNPGNE